MKSVRVLGEWINGLPVGCELCIEGDKTVIFVTGACHDNCYYCPISNERRREDAFYVDEEEISSVDELLTYIEIVGGRGASLTGGDPLLVLEKTIDIIKALKNYFGEKFHIHLYTSGRYADLGALRSLERAGLDEIRFHPIDKRYWEKIRLAKEYTNMSVGAEIPAIPGQESYLKELILYLEKIGAEFINLNELEVSETNKEALLFRGFRINTDGVSISGSRETALEILKWARENNLRIKVHFCPAKLKDAVQTLKRLRRISERIRAPHQHMTRDGLLTWVEIETGSEDPWVESILRDKYIYTYRDGVYYVEPSIDKSILRLIKRRYSVRLIERSPVVLSKVNRRNIIENIYEL